MSRFWAAAVVACGFVVAAGEVEAGTGYFKFDGDTRYNVSPDYTYRLIVYKVVNGVPSAHTFHDYDYAGPVYSPYGTYYKYELTGQHYSVSTQVEAMYGDLHNRHLNGSFMQVDSNLPINERPLP